MAQGSFEDALPLVGFSSLRVPTSQSQIPRVAKAGSLSSPPVLSPSSEGDFFLTGSHDSLTDDLPNVVPSAQLTATIPLFSPSEGCADSSISTAADMYTSMAFADANPVNYSLPTPPLAEPERLRLPSFDLLGIAAPHPDDIERRGRRASSAFRSPWFDGTCDEDQMDLDLDLDPKLATSTFHPSPPRDTRPSLHRGTELITPPEDSSNFQWTKPIAQSSGSRAVAGSGDPFVRPSFPASHARTRMNVAAETGPEPPAAIAMEKENEEESPMWLEPAMSAIIQSVNVSTLTGGTLRVLSHALPSPSIPGHSFARIIDHLRVSSPSNPIQWINLLHAVPGRFNLADLPSSPPATPGLPLGGGDDYFTTKTFESAVPAVDFDANVTPFYARHNPLAAPGSINLSMVERYIPPTSANEFANLFDIRSPSLLIDRMAELSPGNGCLVFIYPTKTGAETFLREYLGPILDPMLRTTVIVNNYTANLSTAIGRMLAVERLPQLDSVRQRTETLCNQLNLNSNTARQRLHGTRGDFQLVYADAHYIELDRAVWADWWIKQEKPRIRVQVANYFASRIPAEGTPSPASLIQDLLDGVANRPSPEEPSTKIEVGVYVIKRGGTA